MRGGSGVTSEKQHLKCLCGGRTGRREGKKADRQAGKLCVRNYGAKVVVIKQKKNVRKAQTYEKLYIESLCEGRTEDEEARKQASEPNDCL